MTRKWLSVLPAVSRYLRSNILQEGKEAMVLQMLKVIVGLVVHDLHYIIINNCHKSHS